MFLAKVFDQKFTPSPQGSALPEGRLKDWRNVMIWSVTREPDDKLADVRISLGKKSSVGSYMVFRGDPRETVELLSEALRMARRALPAGDYTDHRGRPQG
jgi:hypothetical protein